VETNASLPARPGESEIAIRREPLINQLSRFPWWFVALVLIAIWAGVVIFTDPDFNEALGFIIPGIRVTIVISLSSYGIALILGLVAGLGRISRSVVFSNLATLYVEMIRGIPMLVLIFFIAFVGVPASVAVLEKLGILLSNIGLAFIGDPIQTFENSSVPMEWRAVIALAVTYGAFLAEIFRAGIQSIGRGQMEAARSVGMSYGQSMRYIILPQAVRNVLPALGNDFVAMVKDSSLVSVLAIRDITQRARLYAGSTFRFPEAYVTLAVLYLTLVVTLSLLVRLLERRMHRDA